MHSRLLLLLLFNFIFSQSYYESAIGRSFDSHTARSLSLSSSSQITETTGFSILFNPSNLSKGKELGLSLTGSNISDSRFERRGLIVKDSFGDFLAESDYVKNSSIFNYSSISIKYNKIIFNYLNAGLGLSFSPYRTFDFSYIEEVRGQLSSNDGQVFSRDPLLGYHRFSCKGSQKVLGLGSSIAFETNSNIEGAVGLSFNSILSGDILESSNVDTSLVIGIIVTEDSNKLSSLPDYNVNYSLGSSNFVVIGTNITYDKYLFSLAYQSGTNIDKSISNEDEELLNSIAESYQSNDLGSNIFDFHKTIKTSKIEVPQKISMGFSILDNDYNGYSLILNYELNNYSLNSLKSNNRLSLGVEHYTINGVPLRFSIGYKQSVFSPYISSITSFSGGSSFKYKNFIFDYALQYQHSRYNYPDLFLVEGEFRPDLDIVNDSNLIFLGTLTYSFN